jgi:hypothetical protein
MKSLCCLYVCVFPLLTSECLNQSPYPVSTVYFVNPSHQSVCVSPTVARQRLGKNVTAATNTHATIEELLDASFSMQSVSYQRKVGD